MAERLSLVVVGAHLRGQPLNHELTDLGGEFIAERRTAAAYAMYALDGAVPKPGLVRVGGSAGSAFVVEVWSMPRDRFGEFIERVSAPLCIGRIELDDGSAPLGFLCESHAATSARDISGFSGWRAYLTGPESRGV
jgi:allophanate hydrolase